VTIIVLPFPPSVNVLYAGRGRRYKSKRYVRWEIEARNALRSQPFTPLGKIPLQAHYRFGRPDARIRDICNFIKAPDDLMVHEGVIADDSWIHHYIVEWDDIEGVYIEITPLEARKAR